MGKHIKVTGRVQGVFFRKATQEKAHELHLTGWVKNSDDDSVEVFAQGDETNLDKFIEWCRQGPPRARVQDIQITDEENDDRLTRFSILY